MEEMQYIGVARSAEAAETIPLADVRIEVSPRRWVVLGVFVLFCVSSGFQWTQYTVVGDPVGRYYGITDSQLDWTSLVFMVPLVVFMLPACFLIDRMGLRWGLEAGGTLLAVGSWLKLAGAAPSHFPLALVGQALAGSSQVFHLGAPPRVAAAWFGVRELSVACSAGVLAAQLGYALGFLLWPVLVHPHDDAEDIGQDIKLMLRITAGVSTTVLVLIILLFKDRPELPPSPMQALERCSATPVTLKEFFRTIGTLLTNRNFLLVLVSSGISSGALNILATVLSPIILSHFPEEDELARRVGVVLVMSGMLGTMAIGTMLDKTHRFKKIMLGVYVLMALSNTGFAFALRAENVVLVYISAGIYGFLLLGSVAVCVEVLAEVTHPVQPSTAAGLLVVPARVLGCVLTMTFTSALELWGDLAADAFMTACLVLGAVAACFVGNDYRRLAANSAPAKC